MDYKIISPKKVLRGKNCWKKKNPAKGATGKKKIGQVLSNIQILFLLFEEVLRNPLLTDVELAVSLFS